LSFLDISKDPKLSEAEGGGGTKESGEG